MLATAAQAEVGEVAAADFLDDDSGKKAKKSAKKKGANAKEHEVLSVALLNALPDLLVRFKTDPAILRSITVLPRYICKLCDGETVCLLAFLTHCDVSALCRQSTVQEE